MIKRVRSFFDFANFYWQFIQAFSEIVLSLTQLTGDILWKWEKTEQEAFKRLKELFIIKPILAQFDYNKKTVIKCDFFGYTTKNMLS